LQSSSADGNGHIASHSDSADAALFLCSAKHTRRPASAAGRFHVRPHLSAALLTRLISAVLARLLTALDDGELRDCDLVALGLAVDRAAFKAEVTSAAGSRTRTSERRRSSTSSGADTERRQSVDADAQRKYDTSRAASTVGL